MNGVPFAIQDNGRRGIVRAEKEYFERDCILRVVSEYAAAYAISFYPVSETSIEVSIKSKNNTPIDEALLQNFFNDCIDEQIRIDLQKEFGSLRQCIVEYVFMAVERKHV